jgi:hypothetical protein
VPLVFFLLSHLGTRTGLYYIDSTALAIIIAGSSWVSGWWTFGRDEVHGDWLRGDLSIAPGAFHVLVIPGEPPVVDR